jgi:hypothetical protein
VLNRIDAGMQECRNEMQLRCGEESEVVVEGRREGRESL